MTNIVITGTSGVGKTFLEETLEKLNLTFQLPKYTNRPQRPNENPVKTVSITTDEFASQYKNFFFTLEYNGFKYGWKHSDLKSLIPSTLAITLESLEPFLKKNQNFIPILMYISPSNLKLLKKRIKDREGWDKLTEAEKTKTLDKIYSRLSLAEQEIKKNDIYRKITKKYHGLSFEIKDNKTVFNEIIPQITSFL